MISLGDILRDGTLRRILHSFKEATGMAATVIDLSGEPVLELEEWDNCAICRLVRSVKEGRKRCSVSYKDAALQAANLGDLYVFQCHAGIVNWVAPLVVNSKLVGAIACGQITMWAPDEFFVKEVLRRTEDLSINPSLIESAVLKLEQVSTARVQAAAELLFIIATYIVKSIDLSLRQRQEISRQQALLGEAIQERKQLEEVMSRQDLYSPAKERDLLGAVRVGDRARAKSILNDILADILLSQPPVRQEIVKARLLELAVFLSRAAVEAGADIESILGMNYDSVQRLSRVDDFEGLCFWIVKVLDQFIDAVSAAETAHSGAGIVRQAIRYMMDNLNREMTVADIALSVHISPSHLSHLFKKETGSAPIDYLTGLRLEKAKELLSSLDLSISEIAEKCGYEDPSHFSKVFKKAQGIPPSVFRKQVLG
ncbi:MAG: helix-turn-helix domain-containing protein [Firmicutes bacterium]|jgi:two-component system response regulator YesN|nr:helix-turn-helix domain-containing protein [Bacillota bacterium]